MTPLLSARGISMEFPGVRALDGVDFDVLPGEVHALIGENGAGKSTLVRILNGEIAGYGGELLLDGVARRLDGPREAIAGGIAVIPQELQLVAPLSAAENIFLGREPKTALGLVDGAALAAKAAEELAALGETHVPPGEAIEHLEAGQRQLVAIARALSLHARLIIMDEPTASLGAEEAARLERLVRRLSERGVAVVYISHKLDEVRRLAHRVTVLRDGKRIVTRDAAGLDEAEMVRLMVGRDIPRADLEPLPAEAAEVLRVESFSVADADRPGGYRVRDVSLTVRRGEIVGLAGLIGAGRTEFLLALTGALDAETSGRVFLAGREARPADPAAARRAGLVLLPEERKSQAIFPDLSVGENVTLGALEKISRLGWIDAAAARGVVERGMRETGVRAASAAVSIATLSGGNQQKALLARCLFASPSVLLLDEPTRGIDLAARAEIYALLRRLAAEGFGIVLCSSEMSEILTQCHRVVVFRDGRVTAELSHAEATEEKILAAASGAAPPRDTLSHQGGEGGGVRGGSGSPPPRPKLGRLPRLTSILGLAAVVILSILFSPVRGGRPVFLGIGNLTDILRQVAEKGILAVGMTAVVVSGGIDLSVGSVLALAATLTASFFMRGGFSFAAALLAVLGVGALCGAVNGFVVARWRLQPFIATLATMSAARGVARYVSGGTAIPLGFGPGAAPEAMRALAGVLVPYVPVPAVLFLASVLAMHVYLSRTRAGRYLYAIGDNETAARLSGVRVAWHKASVYVIAGLLAAVAGIVHCAQLEQGNPNDGVAYELDAIAAVVIGGTSLSGGVGTVGGTLVGVLTIGVINNIMGLNNVDANLQLILKGVIILGAVWLQRRRR
ncbi:MAG TPA: ATP-binding cassette domain-containing protein [Thermoanaerobaculia bacterium]|nr:ATP-binding cassette domain-containing protein [Thermoanaerobaculia bacterium]